MWKIWTMYLLSLVYYFVSNADWNSCTQVRFLVRKHELLHTQCRRVLESYIGCSQSKSQTGKYEMFFTSISTLPATVEGISVLFSKAIRAHHVCAYSCDIQNKMVPGLESSTNFKLICAMGNSPRNFIRRLRRDGVVMLRGNGMLHTDRQTPRVAPAV